MNLSKNIFLVITCALMVLLIACNDDDENGPQEPATTGEQVQFNLNSVGNSNVSGTATFEELEDNSTLVTINLNGTSGGDSHPAHIHMNSAAEGGGIAIDLTNVDGNSGTSETVISSANDNTPITYDALIAFDGHINVHNSAEDLGTLLAQGDIGENALTGEAETYELHSVSDPAISGEAVFSERGNGETLIEIKLEGDAADSDHPAHIHLNSAAEGGGIAIDLTNVMNGSSKTNVSAQNDGTAITYDELLAFDGYINVHSSSSDLGTLVAQGDIGANVLTGESESYELYSVSDPAISGEAVFSERASGETLIEITLEGDAADSDHPAHIHLNSAAEGGGIAIDLTNVMNGSSRTNVSAQNDGTAITYDELLVFDGYINVHNSSSDLGTLVAQGDIGQNALTGESERYELYAISDPAISGEAVFSERVSGETLIEITLEGDAADSDHPAHIHMNSAAEGGGIAIDLANVMNGSSRTNVSAQNDGTAITYDELLVFDGYINVHNSSSDLGTLVAQGDIGANVLTGESESYELYSVSDPAISGEAVFSERVSGETLIEITLEGDAADSDHPAHIHMNSAAEGGGIAIDLTNVMNGSSRTNVSAQNDGTAITYDELLAFDGYINVHNSSSDLGTLVVQGDIGQNALTGESEVYTLNPVSNPDISGTATFEERMNGATLITIELEGTAMDGDHPAHIHVNDADTGGGIAVSLTNVNGATGISKTNVTQLNDETSMTYDDLIQFDGHINVHQSSAELATLIVQGDIGSNGN